MSGRLSTSALLLGLLSLSWLSSWPKDGTAKALAEEPEQTQPAAQPAHAPAGEKPKYTPELQQKLDRANELLTQVSKFYAQGKYRDAIPMATEALKLREVVLGPVDDHLIANACCWLGVLQQNAGNYAEALPLMQRALKIDEQAYGPDHPDVATDLNDLAGLYQDQGNYTEALPLYQRALTIREKTFGPDHPDITTELNNLAELHRVQGNYVAALPLYQRALKIDEKVHGPDHPDVASDLNNLALLYQAQENYAEALPMYQRALKIQEKALGPDHPDVATELNNLAELYRVQGNYATALPLYQRALKIHEKVLGPDHSNVATDLNNLVLLYQDQGNYAQALPLAHRVLTILRQQLERTAVAQSERQQLLMADVVRFYLNNYLTVSHEAGVPPEQTYAEVLAWKGSVSARQQAMRQFRNNQQGPKVAELYSQLADTARQLDSLSRATPKPEHAAQYRQKLAELNSSLESRQQELAAASVDYRRELDKQKLTPADLQQALPPNTVLVLQR